MDVNPMPGLVLGKSEDEGGEVSSDVNAIQNWDGGFSIMYCIAVRCTLLTIYVVNLYVNLFTETVFLLNM